MGRDMQAKGSRQDEAYRRILALITDGTLSQGDRLPSEPELAARFGVSRPTVREALSRLQNAGVVVTRQGSGSFVQGVESAATNGESFGPIRSLDELRYCLEFRAALEGEAAACAAKANNKSALASAKAALDRLQQAIEKESLGIEADFQFVADYDFHMAVAVASGNPFFARSLVNLRPAIDFSIGVSRSLTLTHSVERLRLVQAEHVAVFRGIESGDPAAARLAMQTHLTNACRRVFEGPGKSDNGPQPER